MAKRTVTFEVDTQEMFAGMVAAGGIKPLGDRLVAALIGDPAPETLVVLTAHGVWITHQSNEPAPHHPDIKR